jgi:hypothetical protein
MIRMNRFSGYLYFLMLLITIPACRQKQPDEWKGNREKIEAILALPDVDKTEVISFALYAVHRNILKLTSNFYTLDVWPGPVRFVWYFEPLGTQ